MRQPDVFDRYDSEDELQQLVECKRCGKGGLHWEEDGGQWRLCTAKYEVHVCDEKRLHAQAVDDFEDLSNGQSKR
jgi:hypothetical protein